MQTPSWQYCLRPQIIFTQEAVVWKGALQDPASQKEDEGQSEDDWQANSVLITPGQIPKEKINCYNAKIFLKLPYDNNKKSDHHVVTQSIPS